MSYIIRHSDEDTIASVLTKVEKSTLQTGFAGEEDWAPLKRTKEGQSSTSIPAKKITPIPKTNCQS